MHPSRILYNGFWKRSAEEFQRLTNIVIRMEGIKGADRPYGLYSFEAPESSSEKNVALMCDSDIGGFSSSHLDYVSSSSETSQIEQARGTPPAYARFHGTISTELPPNSPSVLRTGYAAWKTRERGPTIFGKSVWDIDPFRYLALRIKADGRSYFINVQTESVVPSDLHQHRLFANSPGQWETVLIKWDDFVRTNHGRVVEPQTEMLRQRVRSIGIGITDRVPGPFELCIHRIWATNNRDELSSVPKETSSLKAKDGTEIPWKVES